MWKLARASIGAVQLRFVQPKLVSFQHFHSGAVMLNGSIFGQMTKAPAKEEEPVVPTSSENSEVENKGRDILPQEDAELQKYHLEEAKKEQITVEKFITPLKQKLFEANVAKNGFFKNNEVVKDPESGKSYQLELTPREIEILEPSIYLQSYRIKSSVKKATPVNRFIRGYNVKTAINQLHFNTKKIATELEKLLKDGLKQAEIKGYNQDELYIQQVWAGSDGGMIKRPDIKGRGRTGILHHRFIHLKAILITKQTLERLKWESNQTRLSNKPRMILNNEPLNFKVKPFYKW